MVAQKIKTYYIYAHLNIITAKIYIGWSTKPKERWKRHCRTKDGTYFHNAICKYNKECFECYIIAYSINLKEIKQKEKDFIKLFNTYKNGYNQTKGGDGTSGHKHSEKTKRKWSEKRKGCKGTWKDKKLSKEHCKNISKNHADISGDKNPMRRPEIAAKFKGKKNPMCRPEVILKTKITKLKNQLRKLEQEMFEECLWDGT